MSSSIDNIICARHDVNVTSFVDDSCITCCVVAWCVSQIFVDESLVVAPKCKHKGGWQRHLDYNFSKFIWWTWFILFIVNSHIVTMNWFCY